MKQQINDKFSIAWFKLADCVVRGEKERAFGIYRLLAHSFDDSALANQLEADLLWSFQDVHAVEKYQQAADLYQKTGRLLDSAAVYEHLITINNADLISLLALMDLYKQMRLENKFLFAQEEYMQLLIGQEKWYELGKFSKKISYIHDSLTAGKIIERVVEQIINRKEAHNCCLMLIEKLINIWDEKDQEELMQFLSRLELINQEIYACAYDLLCK